MKNFLKNRYVRWCIIPFYVAISLFLANYSDELFHGNLTVNLLRKFPSSHPVISGKLVIYKNPCDFPYSNITGLKLFDLKNKSKIANVAKNNIYKIFTSSENERITDLDNSIKIEYSPSDKPGFIFIELKERNEQPIDKIQFIDTSSAIINGNVLILTIGELGLHILLLTFSGISLYFIGSFYLRSMRELRFIR